MISANNNFLIIMFDSTEKRSDSRRGPECGGAGCARTPTYTPLNSSRVVFSMNSLMNCPTSKQHRCLKRNSVLFYSFRVADLTSLAKRAPNSSPCFRSSSVGPPIISKESDKSHLSGSTIRLRCRKAPPLHP